MAKSKASKPVARSTPKKSRKPTAKQKPSPKKPKGTRKDFLEHNEVIAATYYTYLAANKKLPTIRYLAEQTQLSESTIIKHLASKKFEDRLQSLKAIQDDMWGTFVMMVKGSKNPMAWRLFFELTEKEWRQKLDLSTNGKDLPASTAKYILPDGTEISL